MSKLVEHVSKKPVPEHQKNIIFEAVSYTHLTLPTTPYV